jgi:hypothetical protein
MVFSSFILAAWAALVFWALGQIWFAQIVIYPLFARVGAAEYLEYHRSYARRIPGPVILPGFACFLAPIAVALVVTDIPSWMHFVNIAAGMAGLAVTVFLEIPRHLRLEKNGKNKHTIDELIRFNWPRTISITIQAALTFAMLS